MIQRFFNNGDENMKKRPDALLLVGPTGSGKTPLGRYLETEGLAGQRCAHFDFGVNLRAFASGAMPGVEEAERSMVQDVLERRVLLQNENFGVAARILGAFIRDRSVGDGDLLILNGLPRHSGQADDVGEIVCIRALVELRCGPQTVMDRIRLNTGGDRLGRVDDGQRDIENKLAIYDERTRPLVERYTGAGVPVYSFDVGLDTGPAEIHAALEARIG